MAIPLKSSDILIGRKSIYLSHFQLSIPPLVVPLQLRSGERVTMLEIAAI